MAGGHGREPAMDGFDVAVARAYARDRGRELEIVSFRWPELESRLAAGDFDVAMSGVTVRADRLARGPMTTAVARADAVLVVSPGAPPVDLTQGGAGLVVAVNRGGHLERTARARLPNATIVAIDDNRSLPGRLGAGGADAIVTDTIEWAAFARDGARGEVVATLSRDRKAYWLSRDEAALALVLDLDAWLAERERDGTLARLRERYAIPGSPGDFGAGARATDLVSRRLMLMPLVAEAKRAHGLPIEAPGREAAIEASSGRAARGAGLDEKTYLALVRAQMEAAKRIQSAVLEAATPAPSAVSPAPFDLERDRDLDLDRDLRPAIDAIDAALRAELARSAPLMATPADLAAALLADTAVPRGFDRATADALARALAMVEQSRAAPRRLWQ